MTSTNGTVSARPKLPALARWALFWTLFIGVGALWGVIMLWTMADKAGMAPLLDQMRANLPLADVFFTTYVWPGVFLLVIICVPNLAGVWLVWRRRRVAPVWCAACGVILVAWTLMEMLWAFGPNVLSEVYLAFGVAQAVMAALWMRRSSNHDPK
ncbi:MAG: hypothetical protein FWF36_03195 [Propionibacteriaceae bacterium]|nr:hypothetical protein [Propionibacteriaceae bacterium]